MTCDAKPCVRCGASFERYKFHAQRQWDARKYCSARCRAFVERDKSCAKERERTGSVACEMCARVLTGTQLRFCSRDCAAQVIRGGYQPSDKTYAMTYAEIAARLTEEEGEPISADMVRAIEARALRKLARSLPAKRLYWEAVS